MIFNKLKTFYFLILALGIATPLEAQSKKIYGPYNIFKKHVIIKTDSGKVTYALPDSFIIQKSEKISENDTLLLPQLDYKIDYINGRITLLRNFAYGTELSIFYQHLPFQLNKSFYHKKLVYQTDSMKATKQVSTVISQTKTVERSSLHKNGSIVRGISLGTNQGLKVESGLRMNISGKIADKIEVVAALTDQTTPIQPEGNTQTLNEIDKVFVQLKSDHFNATLGDYDLSFEGTEFGQYQRKLQGAMGNADFENFDLTLSGAVSKGKYITNFFEGQEGNQGPYQLKGEHGQIDIIVLAGTEKVWINGEPMTRGENNDYIIEYSNGQITFTRHRLVTTDSRITVDFQYSDLKFQRNLYGIRTMSQFWDNEVNLDFRVMHEADDKYNPLEYTLSDENLNRLQAAGDNIDSVYISGDRYVGTNKGYYVVDSTDVQFFRYVGPDSGDHNVSFSFVGTGNGDYKSIGFGKYEYVGKNQGSYLPVIFLQPAQSHDLVDMLFGFNIRKNLDIASELAVSRFDQNTYSNINDKDNTGVAYFTTLNYQSDNIKIKSLNLGKLAINGKYRIVNPRFRYIDRSEEIEKNRKWDLGEASSYEEEIVEIKTSYQPVNDLTMALGAGKISKGTSFNSRRWETKYDVMFSKLPQLHYMAEMIESNNNTVSLQGRWFRQSGNADYRIWKIRPFFTYLGEIKKETLQDTSKSGFKFEEFSSGLELINFKNISVSTSFNKRDDKIYKDDTFKPESQALTQNYQFKYSSGSSLSISTEYIHRDKKYADPAQSDKRTDLGDIQVNYSPFKRAFVTNWYYQISNTQVSRMERLYIKVPQGEGNFRYNEQTKEYEPDDLGDYILRISQTDEFIPVVELRASSRIQCNPEKFFLNSKKNSWQNWLSAISTDTYIRIEEKTRETDVWAIYRLDLSKYQKPGKTIYGSNSFRQDIFLFQNNNSLSLRLRFDAKKEVSFQYLDYGNMIKFMERSIRLTRRFSDRFSAQFEGSRNDKSYQYTNRPDKFVTTDEFSLDISYRPKQVMEFALKSKLAFKSDKAIDPPTRANEFSLMPRTGYSFRGKGRMEFEFEWTQVNVKPTNRIIPYELVGINRNGITMRWMVGFNYNISQYVRATISYNGRREPDRSDTIHVGRAEMRAYF